MIKQAEIRKVIDLYTDDACLYSNKTCAWRSIEEYYCTSDDDSYACLMKRLSDLGVVIKVDKELICTLCGQDWNVVICPYCHLKSNAIEVTTGVKPLGKSPIQSAIEELLCSVARLRPS